MLAALIGFFVLEKIALLRHSHHHEGDGHHHHKGHDRHEAGRGGVMILIGSSLHNLCDGVLVAAAFLTDPLLGVLTAASIIVHEVPHKLGDFVVLLNAGLARRRAFSLILFTSLCSAVGGIIGFFLLQQAQGLVPYVLVVAASSFLYISVADLMPQMHERVSLADAIPQLLLVGVGVALIYSVTTLMHHGHEHDAAPRARRCGARPPPLRQPATVRRPDRRYAMSFSAAAGKIAPPSFTPTPPGWPRRFPAARG